MLGKSANVLGDYSSKTDNDLLQRGSLVNLFIQMLVETLFFM
jgi:hypothetical protein